MTLNPKFKLACLSLAIASLFITAIDAQAAAFSSRSLKNAYNDGYDDGYDDAMDDCPCPPYHYSLLGGFYAGAGASYDNYQINRNAWVLDDRIGSFTSHANGWDGHLFGGYGHYWNNYYLGGEVSVETSKAFGNNTVHVPGTMYYGSFSTDTSVSASILPGYRFNNNGPLAYGRLGFVDTQFKAGDWSGATGSRQTEWSSGARIGLGVELPVYGNFSARLEYDYTKYSSFNNNGATGSSNQPSENRGVLDLLYHFGK